MQYIRHGNGIYNTLLISPPRCGKTTLLRDMIRILSNGDGYNRGLRLVLLMNVLSLGHVIKGVHRMTLDAVLMYLMAVQKQRE